MNSLRKLEAECVDVTDTHAQTGSNINCNTCQVVNEFREKLSTVTPAWERLEKAADVYVAVMMDNETSTKSPAVLLEELREALKGVQQ